MTSHLERLKRRRDRSIFEIRRGLRRRRRRRERVRRREEVVGNDGVGSENRFGSGILNGCLKPQIEDFEPKIR